MMCRQLFRGIAAELSDRTCARSFPAEAAHEQAEKLGPLDDAEYAERPAIGARLSDPAEKEHTQLDSLRLDGFPEHKQQRREAWLKLPREARGSLKRLHVMIGHKPKAVMVQILRGAEAVSSLIEGTKLFRCEVCDSNADTARKSAVAEPHPYVVNRELLVDVFFNRDMEGSTYGWLSIICNGTAFHLASLVMIGHGQLLSSKCFAKFESVWCRWAGYPKLLASDRGLHNRGAFALGLQANGTILRQAALEVPEHIGRAERHGGVLKGVFKKLINEYHIVGKA